MTKNVQIEKNNKKLFFDPIVQADSRLNDIIDKKMCFTKIDEAYIISVTMDNINAVPNYYNKIYSEIEKVKKCKKTKYYFNLNIEEYEMLMSLMEKGNDIFSLLKEYFNTKDLKPFSNYLHDKFYSIEKTKFMKEIYKEATEIMLKIF